MHVKDSELVFTGHHRCLKKHHAAATHTVDLAKCHLARCRKAPVAVLWRVYYLDYSLVPESSGADGNDNAEA